MLQHGGVGDVEVVGTDHGCAAVGGGGESREQAATGRGLARELRGAQHSGAVRD